MMYTSEQAKRITLVLLENSAQAVKQKEFATGGGA